MESVTVTFEQDIKRKLNILHAFQIIHMDIKVLNIMYSKLSK